MATACMAVVCVCVCVCVCSLWFCVSATCSHYLPFALRFVHRCPSGLELMDYLLVMDPAKRPTADDALDHRFFWDDPMPCDPAQ